MASTLDQLYEQDFYAWTRQQVRALRRLRATRPNEAIDWPHLIEEVRDLGTSHRDTVRSYLMRIIEHALKLEYSPARDPREGWFESINNARTEIELRISKTLRRDLATALDKIYGLGRRRAVLGLVRHGEHEAATRLPETCPYTLDQLLDPDWFPDTTSGQS